MPGNIHTWKEGVRFSLNISSHGRVGGSGSLYENPPISCVVNEAELPLTDSASYPADLLF